MKENICALVMAAGFSVRYGSDKRFSGKEALILRSLKNIINTFDTIYLVHRSSDGKLITLLEDLPIKLIQAPPENICLGTSISIGFEHIKNAQIKYESCALFLADMPFIKRETITYLQSQQNLNYIIRPRFDNSSGHPVIFGNKFFDELTEIRRQEGATSIIKKNINCLKLIDVQDVGVIQDIDYRE